jgi:arabinose-5-phosphate isomerase
VALAIMNDRKITCLFVKDAPELGLPALGILHIHDLLRAGVV